jgi:hypothetical protein
MTDAISREPLERKLRVRADGCQSAIISELQEHKSPSEVLAALTGRRDAFREAASLVRSAPPVELGEARGDVPAWATEALVRLYARQISSFRPDRKEEARAADLALSALARKPAPPTPVAEEARCPACGRTADDRQDCLNYFHDYAVVELVEAARGVRLGLLRGEDCTGAIFTRLTRALSPFTDHKEER